MRKSIKRLIAVVCAVVIFLGICVIYPPNLQSLAAASTDGLTLDLQEDVKYFGRTFFENGTQYFSWSNSGFQFSFYGTGATATLKSIQHTAGSTSETAYLKIYVDGALYKDVAVPETYTDITLASGLTEGLHTVKVIKRTSGYYTLVGLSKIQLAAGAEVRDTQKYFDRTMLFIGDDMTTGYGSMVTAANVAAGNVPKYSTATEDSTITYAALTADYFGAENMTVALSGGSGRGIVKNGGGSTAHTAPRFFEYLDYREKRDVAYDHTQYDPDVVVINLGTYDQTAGVTVDQFKKGCKNFIFQVRAAYPDAKILYAYGINGTNYSTTIQQIVSELNNEGDREIYYTGLSGLSSAEKGIAGHPTTEAHAARAKQLIAAVEQITGWTGGDEAGNPVVAGVDSSYKPMEPTDISVMSYNVLAHNNSSQTYENYATRMAKVVTLIKAYDPDVIGLQEVAKVYNSYTHDWPGYLATNLSDYAAVRLDTQANNSNLMLIGNGLMIMYKKDRFTLVSSGCKQMTSSATVDGITDKDSDRWFQWVQLKDNKTGTVFFFYNAHLSIDPTNSSYTSAQQTTMGNIHRSNQCQMLGDHIAATTKATKCPFFIVGDFNTSIDSGNKNLGTNQEGLYKLINYTRNSKVYSFFREAAQLADYTRFTDYGGSLDHIFVNQCYVDVKEYHVAAEGVDGRRTSDHSPNIAYCNFKAYATIDGHDSGEKTLEIATDADEYTFNFTLGTDVTYDIFDGANSVGSSSSATSATVKLNRQTNRFGIRFKDGHGNYVCHVDVVITNSSIQQPMLKATGNVVNHYFANGAYHVLVDGDTLNLATSSGRFYSNPFASRGANYVVQLTTVPAGRSVYYLKGDIGDVYPVYIYKQTTQASADSSVLYIDDDIGNATGTVAFYNGKDVIFATAGANGFGNVADVAQMANSMAACTVYFGPGYYQVNSAANDIVFNKNVTLLGNNHDVSAVSVNGTEWFKAGRKPETVIDGSLVFEGSANLNVTVKGFTIEGTSLKGPIYIDDSTSSNTSIVTHVQTLDIQNNIITGGGNGEGSSPAAIQAYSGAQVTGTIKNNYLRCTNNQYQKANGYTRGVKVKNSNGLIMESNYFIGYELVSYFTDVISDTVAGNCVYSAISNRYEHCGTAKNVIKGITENTTAFVTYNKNDFVRCGGTGDATNYAIAFDFTENKLHNNFANIKVSILRNNFYDCFRSVDISRTVNTSQTGNMAEMALKIKANNFIQPTEGKWSKYFHSIRFSFLVDSTMKHNVSISDTKWDFAGNTFKSKFLDQEALSGEDTTTPAFNYVYYTVSYNGTSGNSFNLTANHFK